MKTLDEFLYRIQDFLLHHDQDITTNQMKKVLDTGVSETYAYRIFVEEILNLHLEEDEYWKEVYLPRMISSLSTEIYQKDPYYQNIRIQNRRYGKWKLKRDKYDPYQAFIWRDFVYQDEKVFPQIGFFSRPFYFPAVYEGNRLWMSITPNEIETMKEPIAKAHGKVVTLGLGLGYFAYMASIKQEVESVTIVERDESVIHLFKEVILPQFSHPEKIHIIHTDAFDFLSSLKDGDYDYLFADLWHDAGDGKPLYLAIKNYEKKLPHVEFQYWIEDTIRYYL